MLTFAAPDVELLYQSVFSKRILGSMWVFSLVAVMGWALSMSMWWFEYIGPQARFSAVSMAFIFHFLPSIALVVGIPYRPAFFSANWQRINAVMQVLQLCVWNHLRDLLIMQVYFPVEDHGTLRFMLQAFLTENIFLVSMWLRMLAFPTGFESDIAIATAFLGVTLYGNQQMCVSKNSGNALVTASEPLLGVTQRASAALLKLVAPFCTPSCHFNASPPPTSCTALLAFWEVVGWWLACMVIICREVGGRLMFIRAHKNVLEMRQKWPFDSVHVVNTCLTLSVILCLWTGLVWDLVLDSHSVLQGVHVKAWPAFVDKIWVKGMGPS
jgi:hypothetical protein